MKLSDMKIMVVSDAIQGRNGVGTYYMDLCQHLSLKAKAVELVSPRMGVPHPCQGRGLPMPGDSTQKLYLPKIRKLKKHIKKCNPDVMILPGIGFYSAVAFYLAKRLGIKILFAHQTDYKNLMCLYYGLVMQYVLTPLVWINRLFFIRSDAVVGINQETAEQAEKLSGKKAEIVATPLSSYFCQHPVKALAQKVKTIIFVGRLATEKRLGDFLELVQQRPDLEFIICGDGPLRDKVLSVQEHCQNLSYKGWCSREQVCHYVDEADLLILPSVVEAFGTVALEAMARGRLVMTSPECGINAWPELAEGIFVRNKEHSLAQAVEVLEGMSKEDLKHLASNAQNLALKSNEDAIDSWTHALYNALYSPCPLSVRKRSFFFMGFVKLFRYIGSRLQSMRQSLWA